MDLIRGLGVGRRSVAERIDERMLDGSGNARMRN